MAQTYNFPDKYQGNTFTTQTFTMVNADGSAYDLTGAAIRLDFRKNSKRGVKTIELEIGSGVTLTDAANGEFTVGGFEITAEPGKYSYDLLIELAGVKTTYLEGTLEVLPSSTD